MGTMRTVELTNVVDQCVEVDGDGERADSSKLAQSGLKLVRGLGEAATITAVEEKDDVFNANGC